MSASHPARFGRFRVLDRIGVGQLGPVFRARDEEAADAIVAVKWFSVALPEGRLARLVEEFEATIAADLGHPALVRSLAAGVSDGRAYLAREYVAADSLEQMLHDDWQPSIDDVLRIATELAGAVDFAAVANVHHLSLNVRDVLVRGVDTRVTGFGVAQALRRVDIAVPRCTRPAAAADSQLDRRTDIVALARVVRDLLFTGPLAGARVGDRERMRMRGPADPAAVRDVLDRTTRTGSDGFGTALEFAAALMTALGFNSSPACRLGDHSGNASNATAPAALFSEVSSRRSPTRSHGVAWALLVATAIGSAGAAAEYRRHRDVRVARVAPNAIGKPATRHPEAPAVIADQSAPRALAEAKPTTRVWPATRDTVAGPTARSAVGTPVAGATADGEQNGMLFVDSRPRGAAVFVDDKFIGTSPVALPEMAASREHAVRLEIEGYRVWSSAVRLRANRINRVLVPLESQ